MGQDVVKAAEQRRHFELLKKLKEGKSLGASELKELKKFEKVDGQSGSIVNTQEEVAKVFQVTTRTVQNWVRDGMPVVESGGYDLSAVHAWMSKRKSSKADDGIDYQDEYRKLKAELVKLDLLERRGQLVQMAIVEKDRVRRILIIKKSLLAMPSQLSPQLVGKEVTEINQMLTAKLREIITEFADGKDEEDETDGHSSEHADQRGELRSQERSDQEGVDVPKDQQESQAGDDSGGVETKD